MVSTIWKRSRRECKNTLFSLLLTPGHIANKNWQPPAIVNRRTNYWSSRHAVNIVHEITQKVTSDQIFVITANQPVYAIEKQLQWIFPTEFKDIVWILGPLHIKQVFIKMIVDWRENGGWIKVHVYANINSNGLANSFLTCSGDSSIKGSYCTHQLTLASLATLSNEAF